MPRRWDEQGRPITEGRRPRRWDERGNPIQGDGGLERGTAYLRGLGDSLSIGAGDEIMGGIAGARAALTGGDFRSAYDEQVERSRANLEQAREIHPASTLAGEVTGYLVPGFGVGKAVTRGASLGGRMLRSAGVGGGFGGTYGFASGETMDERLRGGAEGAVLGAALGGGLHGVAEAAPALWGAGRRLVGLPRSGGRMGVAERARDDLLTAARQNERLGVQSFDDIGPVISQAAQRDPTLTVAEALGRSAINRVVKYSRLPGRTAERAEQTLERNADTFEELTNRLDESLTPRAESGAPLTMRDAAGELDAAFAQTSAQGYERAFQSQLGAGHAARMQNIVERHPEFYERAVNEARIIARGDGVSVGGPMDPRFWHYVKVAAGDVVRSMRREGLGATRARQYTQSLRRLVDELDQIPGYRDARRQWGSLAEAREAMEAGFAFDRMRPAEMTELANRLTPFQRRYLQAGVAERIRDTLARRDNDGLVNIARDLTNRRRGELLRAAFGDRRGPLDEFLEYARLRRQMHADARRMASSQESPTGIITGERMAELVPTGALSAKAIGLRLMYENTIGRLGQRNRDVLGRILLTPVGEFERARGGLLARAEREARRRQSRTRLQRTRGAYLAGIGGAGVYDPSQDE